MLVLGIESTAHTFGIGIIDSSKDGEDKILFNEKSQYKEIDGMDLRKLSDFHVENFDSILIKAKDFLKTINKDFTNLDLISFSRGPGIGNSLKIGSLCAKTLSLKYKIPIVGVSHIKAHLEIGKMLTGFKDPMVLYVSGVNTQIIAKDEFNNYKIYGETEDIGLGNLFDSFARLVGLDFPGGPKIEKLALKSNNYLELPYTIKGMNIALSGIYSNLKQKFETSQNQRVSDGLGIVSDSKYSKRLRNRVNVISCVSKKNSLKGEKIEDLSYSLQETSFAILMEVVERAIAYTKKKEFVIVGGVASNKRLEKMAKEMCKLRKVEYESFNMQYAMDNGAMIAWQGYVDRKNSQKDIKNLKPKAYINIESKF